MTKKQWWERWGLKAFFRNSEVFLFSPALFRQGVFVAYTSYIRNGDWMNYDRLAQFGQMLLEDEQVEDFIASYRLCYCASLGDSTCDFCGQTRSAIRYLKGDEKRVLTVDEVHSLADKVK